MNEAGTDYKLYIDEFLDKYKPNTSVNSSLRLNGLGDLLMFDLNKTFKSLSVDEKIELSVYSEKIIEEEFPNDKLNYLNRIWGMEISSSKDLESVVKIFPRLLPNTRTFYQVKMLIIYSLLEDRKHEVRKKTIRKFLRSMSGNWNEDDDFNRRKLVLMLTD